MSAALGYKLHGGFQPFKAVGGRHAVKPRVTIKIFGLALP
jgi:hypothetical protein